MHGNSVTRDRKGDIHTANAGKKTLVHTGRYCVFCACLPALGTQTADARFIRFEK